VSLRGVALVGAWAVGLTGVCVGMLFVQVFFQQMTMIKIATVCILLGSFVIWFAAVLGCVGLIWASRVITKLIHESIDPGKVDGL